MILLWAVWISMSIIALAAISWLSYQVGDAVDGASGSGFVGLVAGILCFVVIAPLYLFIIIMAGYSINILG